MTIKYQFVIRDGQPLQVIRPDRVDLALALAEAAERENNQELFQKIPQLVVEAGGSYEVMGFMAFRRFSLKEPKVCIVNEKKEYVGEIEKGDSFVTKLMEN